MNPKLEVEFDRQRQNLINKGYPKLAGVSQREFKSLINPLFEKVEKQTLFEIDLEKGKLPFVIIVRSNLVSINKAMSLVEKDGKAGIVKLFPLEPKDFLPIEGVQLPRGKAYLIFNVDRGKASLNIRPENALQTILSDGRSPLTIDEGVSVLTQFPEFLMKNNCFSLLASRHAGDQRVPAIWINANKNPNLGWCWDRNPHTWLGSASCGSRSV